MQGSNQSQAARKEVFPLLELLEHLPGVFAGNLLPALEPRHHAALALTNSALRHAVQHNASRLELRTGSCCLSREHQLANLPNIREVVLKPGNLHEAMFVLPLFFMQAARQLTGLTSLQLFDLLPDRASEEAQCGSCSTWTTTYDLSAILATAAHCCSHLRALDFATHYISDAECAALSLMTGLTRLQLRSTHGTHVGGLVRLSSLTHLASLSVSDKRSSSRTSHTDLAMLLGSSALTHLALGLHSLTQPLLNCLADLHAEDWQAATAGQQLQGAAGRQQQQAHGQLGGAGVRSEVASSASVAAGQPPPLLSLSVVLTPQMRSDKVLHSLARLTGLTRLALGWAPGNVLPQPGVVPDLNPAWPITSQQQLGSLTRLQQLALGWVPLPDVLAALAANTALTHLQLGGLFSALHEAAPVGRLQLPAVRSLTVQLETPYAVLRATNPTDDEPLARDSCLAALAAFPGLTRLELAGRLYAPALRLLPQVLPREGLRELLLPQRLLATRHELGALRQLRGLTRLRLGWRSVWHAGPASFCPELWHVPEDVDTRDRLSLCALTSPEAVVESCAVLGSHVNSVQAANAAAAVDAAERAGAAVADGGAAAAAAAGGGGEACCGEALAGGAPPPQRCVMCAAPANEGCLCCLRELELVGPVDGGELGNLQLLPSLRHLVLRDNPTSTGQPWHGMLPPALTLIEVYRCEGVEGPALEQQWRAPKPWQGHYSIPRVVVEPRCGITAAELGRGYNFMGAVLLPGEEYGLMPDELQGAGPFSSEYLGPDPYAYMQNLLQEFQQQQQQQQGAPGPAVVPLVPPFIDPPAGIVLPAHLFMPLPGGGGGGGGGHAAPAHAVVPGQQGQQAQHAMQLQGGGAFHVLPVGGGAGGAAHPHLVHVGGGQGGGQVWHHQFIQEGQQQQQLQQHQQQHQQPQQLLQQQLHQQQQQLHQQQQQQPGGHVEVVDLVAAEDAAAAAAAAAAADPQEGDG